jgi:dTDP-4-dehydrorhamnose reductase
MRQTRILIIGARGFLGSYAIEAAGSNAEVTRGERSDSDVGSVRIDISDRSSVDDAFASASPDCVLLLAAMADIDRCEAHPAEAYAVNVLGAEHVASACARSRVRLVFASTGAVFDGRKQGYREDDAVSPVSVYGKTKVEAEEVVRALVPSAAIVRLSLVIGWARVPGTNSMLDSLRERWNAGKPVAFPSNEIRNPIHTANAAKAMIALLLQHRDASGIYHAGAADFISRYELGQRLAFRMNVSADLVRPQLEPIPGRAPRGEHHFLLPGKLQELLGSQAQTCEQVIERCFA